MIGLFVDGSYLRKAWRSVSLSLIDYEALYASVQQICGDTIAVAYWFDAQHPDVPNREKHAAALMRAGFRTKLNYRVVREPQRDGNGETLRNPVTLQPLETYRQKGVDVGLALAVDRSYRSGGWSQLVLVAGDADFSELVQDLVEREGVRCWILGTKKSVSCALLPYSTFIELRAMAPQLILADHGSSRYTRTFTAAS